MIYKSVSMRMDAIGGDCVVANSMHLFIIIYTTRQPKIELTQANFLYKTNAAQRK